MKKILSLVLAVVMIMAMAIPAFAATSDEIAPYAVCTGSHTQGTYQGQGHDWVYGSNTICYDKVSDIYECAVCHKIYSVPAGTYERSHSGPVISATCNGTMQTWVQHCTKCDGKYTTYDHACGKPGHAAGNCPALPV